MRTMVAMAPRDPAGRRAIARTLDQLRTLGRELRQARLTAGLSQARVAAAASISRRQLGRIEAGQLKRFDALTITRVLTAVGLELGLRAFPRGVPIRDLGHVRLLERLRARLSEAWGWRLEVPLRGDVAGRAWDAVATLGPMRVAFEAETRLYDIQAQMRRITAKSAVDEVDRVILVVAETHLNRRVLREVRELLRPDFPLDTRAVMLALAAGRDPGANGIVLT
jgi:transcriptional regulator with XRE-family HTH domain